MMQRYQSVHRVIEAIQYNGKNAREIEKWSEGMVKETQFPWDIELMVKGRVRSVAASVGDYICKDWDGFMYPIPAEEFKYAYEPLFEA